MLTGHAIEARVYAETASITGGTVSFLPTGGQILALREPSGPGVRVDSGIVAGGTVGSDYDPMLSKVIAHGADRAEALRRLDAALAATTLLGLDTNIGFLRALLADDDVRAARLDTGLVGRRARELAAPHLPDDVLGAVAGYALLRLEPRGEVVDPFDVPGGWRIGEPAWTTRRLVVTGHDPIVLRVRGRATDAEIAIGDAPPVPTSTAVTGPDVGPVTLLHSYNGRTRRYDVATAADGVVWISRDGEAWSVREQAPLDAARTAVEGAGGPVASPMPGTVTVVGVTEGQEVTAGQMLVVVEAMKMEHVLTAPLDGVVRELKARVGGTVARGAALLVVEPAADSENTTQASAEGTAS